MSVYMKLSEGSVLDQVQMEYSWYYMSNWFKHLAMFSIGEERIRESLLIDGWVSKVDEYPLISISFDGYELSETFVFGFVDGVGGELELCGCADQEKRTITGCVIICLNFWWVGSEPGD